MSRVWLVCERDFFLADPLCSEVCLAVGGTSTATLYPSAVLKVKLEFVVIVTDDPLGLDSCLILSLYDLKREVDR